MHSHHAARIKQLADVQIEKLSQRMGPMRRGHQVDAGVVAEIHRVELIARSGSDVHQFIGCEQCVVHDETSRVLAERPCFDAGRGGEHGLQSTRVPNEALTAARFAGCSASAVTCGEARIFL